MPQKISHINQNVIKKIFFAITGRIRTVNFTDTLVLNEFGPFTKVLEFI